MVESLLFIGAGAEAGEKNRYRYPEPVKNGQAPQHLPEPTQNISSGSSQILNLLRFRLQLKNLGFDRLRLRNTVKNMLFLRDLKVILL